jgi:dihydrolipoamide dehydrogenase
VIVHRHRADGNARTFGADYVLVSIGRRRRSPASTPRRSASRSARGEIVVDDQMRTNLPNVYAIGDAVGGKLLAHKAEEEG